MAVMTNKTDNIQIRTPEVPTHTRHLGRRVLRGVIRTVGALFALILGVAIVGVGYEAVSSIGDTNRYPPRGTRVDVGGYQLHIQCTGTGSPTVVLDAGLTGMSLDWYLVQAEIAKTSRVCSYDRAGMGWSDPGPQPRTPSRIAGELHTLLTNAGIPGPYVLVGHSLAGKNVRMFAIQHPDKVAGMVLVDARGESMDANISPADRAAFEQEIADSATQYGVLRRLGLVRLIGADQWGAPAMPREIRTEGALFRTGQRGLETSAAEALERATDDAQLRGASSLGDRPLIVLASEVNMETLPGWPEAQRQQAELSTKGRLAVVAGSGHYIQWDNPAVVIDAVRQVVTEARGQ